MPMNTDPVTVWLDCHYDALRQIQRLGYRAADMATVDLAQDARYELERLYDERLRVVVVVGRMMMEKGAQPMA